MKNTFPFYWPCHYFESSILIKLKISAFSEAGTKGGATNEKVGSLTWLGLPGMGVICRSWGKQQAERSRQRHEREKSKGSEDRNGNRCKRSRCGAEKIQIKRRQQKHNDVRYSGKARSIVNWNPLNCIVASLQGRLAKVRPLGRI